MIRLLTFFSIFLLLNVIQEADSNSAPLVDTETALKHQAAARLKILNSEDSEEDNSEESESSENDDSGEKSRARRLTSAKQGKLEEFEDVLKEPDTEVFPALVIRDSEKNNILFIEESEGQTYDEFDKSELGKLFMAKIREVVAKAEDDKEKISDKTEEENDEDD